MKWEPLQRDFKNYLRLEKSLSANSIEAYLRDVAQFKSFLELKSETLTPDKVQTHQIQDFLMFITELGMSERSQARIVSGLKSFFRFLILDEQIEADPTQLIEAPKLGRKLPVVLSVEEIDAIQAAIDLSTNEGHRNKAIIETLYSCGLRVSELIDLRLSHLHAEQAYIKVIGKGQKERLVPISQKALNDINFYIKGYRNHMDVIDKSAQDIVFLNRRGKKLTRVMIFTIVKQLVQAADIQKNVSPHTFRHSFATHLVEGGADLRVVQEMLGHESILTTEIYTHLDRTFLQETLMMYHPRSEIQKNS
jgi:integrase/recombinase XerD